MSEIHIGTSGFSYDKWQGKFYPEDVDKKRLLSYYAQFFDTVEINSSFYHLPQKSTIKKWRGEVPKSFLICPKISRYITHNKKLLDSAPSVAKFIDVAKELKGQKGPALLQLPPGLKPEYGRQEETLKAFRKEGKGQHWRIAVECRNDLWYGKKLNDLLDQYGASLVVHDMPEGRNKKPNPGADFVYVRFHGPRGDYRGEYGYKGLKEPGKRMSRWLKEGRDVYAFFNNDADGFAPFDALKLQEILA
jgi:uncharacterized protein YecE (DUF72 family)